jgi:putative Mg2+ transporter-C (MgtC) family protein
MTSVDAPILTDLDMAIRLGLSFVAGSIVGFERSSRHQVAGLRTHVLICVGATLLMLLSIWIPQEFNMFKNGDPGRIAAQVVSGIGFLGAGAIIRLGNNVKGLTTAASLWLVSAVGLAIGAGLYFAAGMALGLSLFTLVALDVVEKRLFPSERNKILELSYRGGTPDTKKALAVLASFGVRVQTIDVDQTMGKGGESRLRVLVGLPTATDLAKLVKALKDSGDIERIEVKEKY